MARPREPRIPQNPHQPGRRLQRLGNRHIHHPQGKRLAMIAVTGSDREAWKNKKDHLTPNYLTDIDQIMTVQI